MINLNGPKAKAQTLDEKQEEKARLLSKFRAHRRADWAKLLEQEPRLGAFETAIKGASPATVFMLVMTGWLRSADTAIKYAALRLIDKEASRQVRFAGGEPLDDPLPPKRNLYIAAREILNVR